MDKLYSVSWRMRCLFLVLAVLVPPIRMVGWAYYEPSLPQTMLVFGPGVRFHLNGLWALMVTGQRLDDVHGMLTAGQHFALVLTAGLPAGVSSYAFVLLAQLFGFYARAQVFTIDTVHIIRRLGWALVTMALVAPLYSFASTAIASWTAALGVSRAEVGFEAGDLTTLIGGVIVLVMAWVMNEARRLQDEVNLTI